MLRTRMLVAALAFVPFMLPASAGAAEAGAVQLHGGGHFQGAGQPLVEAYIAKTGAAAEYTPGNTGGGGFAERLQAGAAIDVVVLNRRDMDRQIEAGLIRPGTDISFAEDGYGVAVLKANPVPDVSTPEMFREALLNARAVGRQFPDPEGNSGRIAQQMLVRLGILEQMEGEKTVIIENSTDDLEAGRVDFVIWSYTEILRNEKLHGAPVPREVDEYVTQAIGIPASSQNPEGAQAFIEFIRSPDGAAILHQWGLEALPQD